MWVTGAMLLGSCFVAGISMHAENKMANRDKLKTALSMLLGCFLSYVLIYWSLSKGHSMPSPYESFLFLFLASLGAITVWLSLTWKKRSLPFSLLRFALYFTEFYLFFTILDGAI